LKPHPVFEGTPACDLRRLGDLVRNGRDSDHFRAAIGRKPEAAAAQSAAGVKNTVAGTLLLLFSAWACSRTPPP
jgi:hypothetical protein